MATGQSGSRNHHSTGYDLSLAWRNIRSRPVQSAITLIVVALALGLFVIVMALNDGLQRGIIKASDPFGVLVVGAKGSAQQLVLSTLLLQETPVGNIHRDIYEELRADPRVALAVPMAFGDNVGGARIIGTNQDFFQLRPAMNEPVSFVLSKGQTFAEPFETVLGSQAAAELGLTVGDEFFPQHGVEVGLEDDVHAVPHRVVGILAPSNTAYDNAVFTSLESVWSVHAEHEHQEEGEEHHEEEQHLEEASGNAADGLRLFDFTNPDPIDQVTAVLVRPSGFIEANELWRDLRIGSRAQAAFPGKELGGLFDLLNQGQQILTVVGYLAAIMAALTVLLAIYSATVAREHTIAVMRGLGSRLGRRQHHHPAVGDSSGHSLHAGAGALPLAAPLGPGAGRRLASCDHGLPGQRGGEALSCMRSNRRRLAMVATNLFLVLACAIACRSPQVREPSDVPTARVTPKTPVAADVVRAPDFSLRSLRGEDISLPALQGNWVVVNFWASWCEPCVSEMPFLDALPAEFPDDLVVLAINLREPSQEVEDFAREHDLHLPILLAPDDETLLAYQVTSLPLTVVVSPEGEIVRRFPGELEPDEFETWLRGFIHGDDDKTADPWKGW